MKNQEQIQAMNQKLVELSKSYDKTQKARASMDMRGQDSSYLYKEMIEIENKMKYVQDKRDALIENKQ